MLRNCGLYVMEVATVEQSRSVLGERTIPLIFCEDHLADGSYRDLLAALHRAQPSTELVVLSRTGEVRDYLEAMQSGAFDFLSPPIGWTQLENILARAARRQPAVRTAAPNKVSAA
jgi:DNA-binding NtrC family response regulator